MILLERERLLSELEQKIGYSFRSRALLDRALTHRSFANERSDENCQHNEAMEFLGDSVLGFVVSAWLLERFPDLSEGKLSKMKAYLVSESSLVGLAGEIELGRYILLNRGEEKTGGRHKHALLADAYEALIGVLYVDGGIDVAERFLRRELGDKLMSIDPASMIGADYKSALQERLQAAGGTVPEYAVVEVTGPDHRRTFRVELRVVGRALATGEGHTIKIAQQEAARAGLESDSLPGVIDAIRQSQKRETEGESERAGDSPDSSIDASALDETAPGERSEAAHDEVASHFSALSPRAESHDEVRADSQSSLLAMPAGGGSIEPRDDGRISADAESEAGVSKF
ncbi:MAG TPA: ribonuclease III [Blastocatellia bacterium]|nr:ribonuclease III [Blastocatellia bacterium]